MRTGEEHVLVTAFHVAGGGITGDVTLCFTIGTDCFQQLFSRVLPQEFSTIGVDAGQKLLRAVASCSSKLEIGGHAIIKWNQLSALLTY